MDKIYIALSIALLSFGLGIFAHMKWVEADKVKQMQAILDSSIQNEKLKRKLEENHVQAEAAINTLLSVTPPPVRMPKFTCPSKGESTASGIPAIQTYWFLVKRTEEIADRERLRAQEIVGGCELEKSDLMVIKEWAVKQGE